MYMYMYMVVVGTNQGSGVLAVESGDVVCRHFADVDLEVEEPAWEERDIARVQNVDVWSPYSIIFYMHIIPSHPNFQSLNLHDHDMIDPSNNKIVSNPKCRRIRLGVVPRR